MASYMKAPAEVVEIAEDLIAKYHEHLQDARIGFIMRLDRSTKNGREVLGKARKVNAEQQMFMDLDFVIWLYWDVYDRCEPMKKRALIDHELCHCKYDLDDDPPASMAGHDIEEFNVILERYGFWGPGDELTKRAIQGRLDIGERTGKVVSLSSLDGIDMPPEKADGIRKVWGEFERLGYTEEQALEALQQIENGEAPQGVVMSDDVRDKMRSFKRSLAAAGGDVTLTSASPSGEARETTLTHEQLSEA